MRPIFRMKLAFRIIMFIACQNSTHSEEQNVSFAYYKEINLTRLIRSPICVIILRQMLQVKHEHMTEREIK